MPVDVRAVINNYIERRAAAGCLNDAVQIFGRRRISDMHMRNVCVICRPFQGTLRRRTP
jgi:hypothetical protein